MNPLKKTSRALFCALAFSVAPMSFADLYSDVAAIAMNSSNMNDITSEFMPYMKTLDETSKEISKLTGQHFDWVEDVQWRALTSSYQMGRVIENAVPTELWSSDQWDEAIAVTSGGNSSRFNQLKSAYAAQNPTITSSSPSVNVGQLNENTYTQKAAVTNTALAASQYVYEDTDNRVHSFDQMKAWIDDVNVNQNEKAAVDLNTRVLIEIGYIQNEMLKLQSIQAQVAGIKAQEEINANTADKNFFKQN